MANSINGTSGNDTIIGPDIVFNPNDVISGLGGDDSLSGRDGTDTLIGGEGRDTLRGGDDNDRLDGGNADDSLFGDNGNDSLIGGDGNDTATGGNGDDTLSGGNGNDRADGGNGNDSLFGGEGDDSALGGAGIDVASGGGGNDTFDGGEGDDFGFGNNGNDTVNGGNGNDSLVGDDGDDFADGGAGNDTVTGGNGNDSVDGGAGNDFLDGGNGDDLFGDGEGNGNDTVFGGEGDDIVLPVPGYGGGNDSLIGAGGNDFLFAGNGDDTVYGGDGNDTAGGFDGDDFLSGDDGDDTLFAGAGKDTADGGDDNDSLFGEGGDDLLDGGNGDDTVNGGDGNDFAEDRNGNDSLDGGNGNDSLGGGNGDDTVDGGNGDDTLDGGDGDDSLSGGDGNDQLFSGNGGNTVSGGNGDDTVSGGNGDDLLDFTLGNSTLEGGPGADTFRYDPEVKFAGTGSRFITDLSPGDAIRIVDAIFSGPVGLGNGTTLGLNQIQLSTGGGTSTLFVGADTTPGADVAIQLAGTFIAANFVPAGNTITIVQTRFLSIADAAIAEGEAGQQNLLFTASLTAPAVFDVTFTAATGNGTATAGSDFAATAAQLIIPAGQTSASFAVPIFGDAAVEPSETFTVTLSNIVNAVASDNVATGTILDDDGSRLISISPALVGEGDDGTSNASFTINLSAPSQQDVIVTASTSNGTALAGSDYVATTGQVTIPAGQTGASFSVPIIGDTVQEPTESFTVTLSNPVNASLGLPSSVLGTILDSDQAAPSVLSIGDASVAEDDGGAHNLVFTLSLSAPAEQAIALNAATGGGTAAAGADYTTTNLGVVIAAGETSATVAVPVLGDMLVEANETFGLTLSNLVGAQFAGGGATLAATGTILDDDASLLSIGAASLIEPDDGTANLVFPLTLSAALAGPSVVSFRTLAGSARSPADFTGIAFGSATIPAGETAGTLAIAVKGDTLLECDETFTVELINVTGGALLEPTAASATGTIVNDDGGVAPVIDRLTLAGDAAADALFGTAGGDSLAGGDGDDTVVGAAEGDILDGGGEADFVLGESGADSASGGEGNDILVGGEDEDTLVGGNGDDALFGGADNDTAIGGNGADVLLGEDGDDLLCGEEGNDYLIGGAGADLLDAGNGDDRVVVDGGDVFAGGGAGLDVLAIAGAGITSVNLGNAHNQNAGGVGPILQGFEAVDASAASAAVSLIGAVIGGTGNALLGSALDDTIAGSAAADILFGNAGSDILDGGAGNDSLIGGFGNDTMNGGVGEDSFFFAADAGSVTRISDFAPGEDSVVLPLGLGLTAVEAQLLLDDQGGNAVLSLDGGASLTFVGVAAAQITADDFAIV